MLQPLRAGVRSVGFFEPSGRCLCGHPFSRIGKARVFTVVAVMPVSLEVEDKENMPTKGSETTKSKQSTPSKRKGSLGKAGEPKTKAQKKSVSRSKAATSIPQGPKYSPDMRPPLPEEGPLFKALSWNVASLRSLLKKTPTAIKALAEAESPDAICLQEHKLQESGVDEIKCMLGAHLKGWHTYFTCSSARKGYSGVATLCRDKPVAVRYGFNLEAKKNAVEGKGLGGIVDDEGRMVTVEFAQFHLLNVYVPNAGDGLKRLDFRVGEWDGALAKYLRDLKEATGKPVVITGDLNCAHQEIDIHDPKGNLKSAGFTPQERASFARHLLDAGYVDTFRQLHPTVVGYTYWSFRNNCRAQNKGWRLDYFLAPGSWCQELGPHHSTQPNTNANADTTISEAKREAPGSGEARASAEEGNGTEAAAGGADEGLPEGGPDGGADGAGGADDPKGVKEAGVEEGGDVERWAFDGTANQEAPVSVVDSYLLQDVMGSDHCPVGIVLKL